MARPSKLTPEVQKEIMGYIRTGNFTTVACAAAGIDTKTYYTWLKRGAEGEEPFASFAAEVELAEAQGEVFLVTHVWKLAKEGDLKALEYILGKKYRNNWAERQQIDHRISKGEEEKVTPEMANRLVREAFGEHALKKNAPRNTGTGVDGDIPPDVTG